MTETNHQIPRIKNNLRDKQDKFISVLEQYYVEYGNIPTKQKLLELKVVSDEDYDELIKDSYILNALEILGITIDTDAYALTPKQLAAIQVMFDFNDGRSDSKKLRDLGISGQTWQNWLRDPSFQRFLRARTGNLLDDNSHDVDRALLSKARAGNAEAMRLYYSIAGKHSKALSESPKIGNVDAQVFLMKLMEILQEVLANEPDKIMAIGTRLLEIQNPISQHPRVIEALPITIEQRL